MPKSLSRLSLNGQESPKPGDRELSYSIHTGKLNWQHIWRSLRNFSMLHHTHLQLLSWLMLKLGIDMPSILIRWTIIIGSIPLSWLRCSGLPQLLPTQASVEALLHHRLARNLIQSAVTGTMGSATTTSTPSSKPTFVTSVERPTVQKKGRNVSESSKRGNDPLLKPNHQVTISELRETCSLVGKRGEKRKGRTSLIPLHFVEGLYGPVTAGMIFFPLLLLLLRLQSHYCLPQRLS